MLCQNMASFGRPLGSYWYLRDISLPIPTDTVNLQVTPVVPSVRRCRSFSPGDTYVRPYVIELR